MKISLLAAALALAVPATFAHGPAQHEGGIASKPAPTVRPRLGRSCPGLHADANC